MKSPKPIRGVTKYGDKGLYNKESFANLNIPGECIPNLVQAANHSLSKNTWSAYRTAERMLARCQNETNVSMDLPLNEQRVLIFVSWLISRNLSTSTINTYLAGLRQVHLANGVNLPILRTPVVDQVLEGRKHLDAIRNNLGETAKRLPVTPNVMKLIKAELHAGNFSIEKKLLVWSVSTLAFAGSFRIHEILCRNINFYDPVFTLLQKDIKLKEIKVESQIIEILQVKIKSEKSDRVGVNTIVDVYSSGGCLCPVRAYKKFKRISKLDDNSKPAFREETGAPLTGRGFNTYLKTLLSPHLDYSIGSITAHSFRAGLPSMMGKLGYVDEEIMAVGRWSSRAFENYLKLPRTKRLAMAKHLGSLDICNP